MGWGKYGADFKHVEKVGEIVKWRYLSTENKAICIKEHVRLSG